MLNAPNSWKTMLVFMLFGFAFPNSWAENHLPESTLSGDGDEAALVHAAPRATCTANPPPPPEFSASLNQEYRYRIGGQVDLTLPAVNNATSPVTYRLTRGRDSYSDGNWNFHGIAFDSTTRVLSGRATGDGNVPLKYHARDACGLEARNPLSTTFLIYFDVDLPQENVTFARGQIDIYYKLTRGINVYASPYHSDVDSFTNLHDDNLDLPLGLRYQHATTEIIGQAPDADFYGDYISTVVDPWDNRSVSATFAIIVGNGFGFGADVIAATYTLDNEGFTTGGQTYTALTLPAVGDADDGVVYSSSGNLPTGLTRTQLLNSFHIIAGAPSTTGMYTYTLTATADDSRSASVTLQMVVIDRLRFVGTQDKIHTTIGGVALDIQLPKAAGGVAPFTYAYRVSPSDLPNGLRLDATTAKLVGIAAADAAVGNFTYEYYAYQPGRGPGSPSIDMDVYLQVYPALAFVSGEQPAAEQTFTVGMSKSFDFLDVTGGRTPYAYSLDLSAVMASNSLQFDAATRTLSGAFAAASNSVNLTYRVTDANGAQIVYPFSAAAVVIGAGFTDVDLAALNGGYTFRVNQPIPPTTLPQSQGGITPLSYKLTVGANSDYVSQKWMIAGVTFDANTRIVSGRPTQQTLMNQPLRYHVRDAEGNTASALTEIYIAGELSLHQKNLGLRPGQTMVNIGLARARNGIGTLTYTLTNVQNQNLDLPGLVYKPTTRRFKSAGGMVDNRNSASTYVFSVQDMHDDAIAQSTFAIYVSELPKFEPPDFAVSYTADSALYTMNGMQSDDALTLPAVSAGAGGFSYVVSGALPSGLSQLSIDNDELAISGAPSATGEFTFIRIATDAANQAATFTLTISVSAADSNLFGFADSQEKIHATINGKALDVQLPTALGGVAPLSYSVAPATPNGLQLNRETAELSGTVAANATVGNTSYTLTATEAQGATAALTFEMEVYPALTFVAGAQPAAQQTFTVGVSDSLDFLQAEGGRTPHIYSLDLSAVTASNALTFDADAKTLSGAFASPSVETALTYSVVDANGAMLMYTFSVTALGPPNVPDAGITLLSGGYTFRVNRVITETTLPAATDGVSPLTYKLTGGANSQYGAATASVAGVTFDAVSRVLSGTPTQPGDNQITYHVRDANGATMSASLNIFIANELTLTQADVSFDAGQTGVDFALAQAGEAVGLIGYTLTDLDGVGLDDLPGALQFASPPPKLTGDAGDTAVADASFVYTATDGFDGASAKVTFTLSVIDDISFAPPAIVATYTVGATGYIAAGVRHAALTLPAANGGGAISYMNDVVNLPNGLAATTLSDSRVAVAGAPSVAGDFTYTRIADDSRNRPATFALFVYVAEAPDFPADSLTLLSAGYSFRAGTAVETTLPTASNGVATLTYNLTAGSAYSAVAFSAVGLSLDTAARILAGTPTGAYQQNLTYHVRDANGATASAPVNVFVAGDLALAQADITLSAGAGVALTFTEAVNSVGAIGYALTDLNGNGLNGLPNGIQFDAATRILNGVASAVHTPASFVYAATDDYDGDVAMATFAINVVSGPAFAPISIAATYTRTVVTYTIEGRQYGVALTLPASTEGKDRVVYSNSGSANFPLMLSSLADKRIIVSGAPRFAGNFTFTRTATDVNNAVGYFTLRIYVAEPPIFNDMQTDLLLNVGEAITAPIALPPASEGAVSLVYQLLPALPAGLTFDSDKVELKGAPVSDSTTREYILTATDVNGASGYLTFNLGVAHASIFTTRDINNPTFTVGATSYTVDSIQYAEYTLPAVDDADNTSFVLSAKKTQVADGGLIAGGLTYDAGRRHISGVPLVSENYEMAYMAIEQNSGGIDVTEFEITVLPTPHFAEGVGDIAVSLGEYADRGKVAYPLPKVDQSTGLAPIVYVLTIAKNTTLPEWMSIESVRTFSATKTITFTPDASPVDLEFSAALAQQIRDQSKISAVPMTFGYLAIDSNSATSSPLTLSFTVTTNSSRDFFEINKEILSKVANAIVGDAIRAISERAVQWRAHGVRLPRASVANHHNVGAMVTATASALADGTMNAKELLTGASISVPFSENFGFINNVAPAEVWASVNYLRMLGDDNKFNWDGDLFNAYLGVDSVINFDALAGLALGFSRGEFDNHLVTVDKETLSSDLYKIDMVTVQPYLSWRAAQIDLWATVGYGNGELMIARTYPTENIEKLTTDISLQSVALGASRQLSSQALLMRVKGEFVATQMNIEGTNKIEAESLDNGLARLSTQTHHMIVLDAGGWIEPSFDFGMRYDYGDSDADGAMEASAGARFASNSGRVDGRVALAWLWAYGKYDYDEWGVDVELRSQPGLDGQGFSLSVAPSYGDTVDRDLWQTKLLQGAINPEDGAFQIAARAGFGLSGDYGLLTLFVEWAKRDADTYRLGLDWSPIDDFVLQIFGRYAEVPGSVAEESVTIRGEARF